MNCPKCDSSPMEQNTIKTWRGTENSVYVCPWCKYQMLVTAESAWETQD